MTQANDVLACNQNFDKEHAGETYETVGAKVMQDQRYKDANKAMKEQQQFRNLIDEYTGKNISQNDKANLDHVVSRKELYEHTRRQQAGINMEDLANKTMREQQQFGNLIDEYTGKNISQNDKVNLDHVVSRKELYENARRQQAGINMEDLANKDKNLKVTNESLNKSSCS